MLGTRKHLGQLAGKAEQLRADGGHQAGPFHCAALKVGQFLATRPDIVGVVVAVLGSLNIIAAELDR